jgi:hypothetical protein
VPAADGKRPDPDRLHEAIIGGQVPEGSWQYRAGSAICCLLPATDCPLPPAHCQLPTANCPLPTAHCQLPTANCPLTTDNQPPTV